MKTRVLTMLLSDLSTVSAGKVSRKSAAAMRSRSENIKSLLHYLFGGLTPVVGWRYSKGKGERMTRTIFATLIALTALPAAAETIPISFNQSHFGLPDFYALETTFDLPGDFSDATLTITLFSVDDRGVLLLNGVVVASSGIFAPGTGTMVLTPGGTNDSFIFTSSASGPFVPVTSGFVTGTNSLSIVVNDTNTGIVGSLSGGVNCGFPNCLAPTGLHFNAEITFIASTVPLPAALPLFCAGLLAAVSRARRRRQPLPLATV